MRLRPYTDDDRSLTEALETDPEVMANLGAPIDRDEVEPHHRRRMREVESGDPWWLVIVVEPEDEPMGTIGIWDAEHDGERIHETGWTVRPAFQGRGIATASLAQLLARARASGEFEGCTRSRTSPTPPPTPSAAGPASSSSRRSTSGSAAPHFTAATGCWT